jgi:hypothetical protein
MTMHFVLAAVSAGGALVLGYAVARNNLYVSLGGLTASLIALAIEFFIA